MWRINTQFIYKDNLFTGRAEIHSDPLHPLSDKGSPAILNFKLISNVTISLHIHTYTYFLFFYNKQSVSTHTLIIDISLDDGVIFL